MDVLLELADGLPRRSLTVGESLIADGMAAGSLFVLLEGELRVEKAGVPIAFIGDAGACVGEVALLLGSTATADVVASEPAVVAVVENASELIATKPELALALATMLATRLHNMTTYLVDLQHQYADHEGGLGMVDVVLRSLMHRSQERSELGSARDPEPEY